jgi:hypothetical protein
VSLDINEPLRKRAKRHGELGPHDQQIAKIFPEIYENRDDGLTCGQCVHREMKKRGLVEETYCGLRLFFIKDADRACEVFELQY